jgi:tetratricopeptide (TPR) repeat protein
VVRTGWQRLGESDTQQSPAILSACVAGIVGLMATTLFDVPWVFPWTTLYVVLLSAMIVAPSCSRRLTSELRVRWLTMAVLGIVVLVLIWGDVAHFFQQRAVETLRDGRFDDAVANLETSVAVDPFLAIYRFQLGIARAHLGLENGDQGLIREAMQAYEEEISHGGDTPINNGNLAWLEWSIGEVDEALTRMQRASSQAPRDSYYQLGLGFLLEAMGDYPEARRFYSAAVAAKPSLIDSAFWQTSEYRREFKTELRAREDLSALSRAWAAYFAGDYTEADGLLRESSQTLSWLILQGRVETAQMQYAAAQETLDRAIAMSETSAPVYLARGQLYLQSGDESEALHDLRIAGQLGERRADIVLGDIAYRAGDLGKAIALYEGSVPGCVAQTAAYDYASQVYHRSNATADFWPESIVCTPYDSLVPQYLHLAEAYRAVGRAEEAEEVCQWLDDFYESSYLEKLDLNHDRQSACPTDASVGQEGRIVGFAGSPATDVHDIPARTRGPGLDRSEVTTSKCQEPVG